MAPSTCFAGPDAEAVCGGLGSASFALSAACEQDSCWSAACLPLSMPRAGPLGSSNMPAGWFFLTDFGAEFSHDAWHLKPPINPSFPREHAGKSAARPTTAHQAAVLRHGSRGHSCQAHQGTPQSTQVRTFWGLGRDTGEPEAPAAPLAASAAWPALGRLSGVALSTALAACWGLGTASFTCRPTHKPGQMPVLQLLEESAPPVGTLVLWLS